MMYDGPDDDLMSEEPEDEPGKKPRSPALLAAADRIEKSAGDKLVEIFGLNHRENARFWEAAEEVATKERSPWLVLADYEDGTSVHKPTAEGTGWAW